MAGTTDTLTVSVPTVFSGVISGRGRRELVGRSRLYQGGRCALTLSGTNTYQGTTALNSGVISVQNGNAFGNGTGAVYVVPGATVQFVGNFNMAGDPFIVSGTGVDGLGALKVLPYRAQQDTLTIQNNNLTLAGNTTIFFNADMILNIKDTISGGGVLTKTGGGMLQLSGANTYVGTTTVSDGILQVQNNGRPRQYRLPRQREQRRHSPAERRWDRSRQKREPCRHRLRLRRRPPAGRPEQHRQQ